MTDASSAHTVALALLMAMGSTGVAVSQASSDPSACAASLSPPVRSKWSSLGGLADLGCPTAAEAEAPVSPSGAAAREATFPAAAIFWHETGPRAGQTFAVSGCLYRLYFQYGGPAGWLGLPTSDAVNTPDGKRQSFEGGKMTFQRAGQVCEAEPVSLQEALPSASPTTPLDQFYDPARGDYLAAASASSTSRALASHYQRLRTEGYVFTEPGPDLIPLKAYWNEVLSAHDEVATAESERMAQDAGYVFDGGQGFIYANPHSGARALKHYRDGAGGHGMVTATDEGEAEAAARGYIFIRIEGYLPIGSSK